MKPQILRDLRFLFSLVVACGPAGVPGAVGRGCGAGLRRGRWPASLMVLLVAPRVFRAPEGPAAREARASLRSAPRLEARPCPPVPPAPSTPVGPGRGRVPQLCASKPGQAPPPPINFARNSPAAFSSIEFASLELQRFGVSRKMTTINYVRHLGGGGVVAARGRRRLALRSLRRPSHRRRLVADVLLGALLRSPAGSCASKCSLSSVSHAIP